MFREVLKIDPQLDSAAASNMERNLTSRFSKISKRFANGLGKAMITGGLVGAALGFVSKILNPLKETQEVINRMLSKSDDLVVNAAQFGTTAGKLLKLQSLGKATGLEPAALFMLISKFQNSVAEAKADPSKETSVRNFVDIPDTADAFFEFMQSLRRMNTDAQIIVQKEVFGEKQILKMSEFLNIAKPQQMFDEMGVGASTNYDKPLTHLSNLNSEKNKMAAGAEAWDFIAKAQQIDLEMVKAEANRNLVEMGRENLRIKEYETLKGVDNKLEELKFMGERVLTLLGKVVLYMEKFGPSRVLKGLIFGKGE